MLKNSTFWLVAAVAFVAAAVGRFAMTSPEAVGPGPKEVAFITGGPGAYWDAAVAGAEAAAGEFGINLVVKTPDSAENVEHQMQLLAVVGSADVDAVAISPIDAERQSEVINQVAGAKPVVTYDSDASGSARHGYVGTSNFSAGLVAGTLVKKAIPEGGKIAVLLANMTKENLIDRLAGLKTRIAESPVPEESPSDPRYTVVGVYTDDGDNETCAARLSEALEEHPDLACLVTLNARQGPVVLETLAAMDDSKRPKLIAFDTPEETLAGVEQGVAFAAIAQDPFSYGYESIRMIDSLCRGDQQSLPVVGRAAIHISVEPVMQGGVEAFRKRLKTRSGSSKERS